MRVVYSHKLGVSNDIALSEELKALISLYHEQIQKIPLLVYNFCIWIVNQ